MIVCEHDKTKACKTKACSGASNTGAAHQARLASRGSDHHADAVIWSYLGRTDGGGIFSLQRRTAGVESATSELFAIFEVGAFLGSDGGKLGERIPADGDVRDPDSLLVSERLARIERSGFGA